MSSTFNLYEAKSHLSELVDRAASGEEIVIAKAGRPLARLVPYRVSDHPRRPGIWAGRVWIADDFDDPLPEDALRGFEKRQSE
ncbi:type II toxin-antitoxin system Phd/YefM family antitoxin [Myxococcota bacterium]|nr:type II toxin-antitoxin system Phd/YefM family antitoxin [Myxococcota bacterium]